MKTLMKSKHPNYFNIRLIIGVSIALITTIILLGVEANFRQKSSTGYIYSGTSESLWQTVSIEDLRDQPLISLWNLHIQPPMLDTIRAILAQIWKMDDSTTMLYKVDSSLYFIWAIANGAIVFLIYWWLSKMTNLIFSAIAAMVFSIHPALITFSVILDSTILSTFLILLFYYIFWRVKEGYSPSIVPLAISFLLLFFTRSIFQWQWLLLMTFSLFLMKLPWRKILLFLSITGIVIGLYTTKQLLLFNFSGTSSFAGFNFCQSINCAGSQNQYFREFESKFPPFDESRPHVLARKTKMEGNINFNNADYLEVNRLMQQQFTTQYKELLRTPKKLLLLYFENLKIYLSPSSKYMPVSMVDQYPLRNFYDSVFSFPILLILLFLAFLGWIIRVNKTDLIRSIGFCLPMVFIIIISIVGERGENMRFKFFIEPVIFVFITLQGFIATKRILAYLRRTSSLPLHHKLK